MSEGKKCSRCGNTIPEGKDNCEQMQCRIEESRSKNLFEKEKK
tara:strand:+ start:36 stop:164 length:129 start_codon:yes stop_codon:yes gene_type:complete